MESTGSRKCEKRKHEKHGDQITVVCLISDKCDGVFTQSFGFAGRSRLASSSNWSSFSIQVLFEIFYGIWILTGQILSFTAIMLHVE